MFTGIVQAVGRVQRIEQIHNGALLEIDGRGFDLADLKLGESIAVNGVCLTVTSCNAPGFSADISPETLSCTTLEQLQAGARVNLERSLTLADRLGGHLVSGHVDGVGDVRGVIDQGETICLRIEAPAELGRYISCKGSVCIDGVSLTVNQVHNATFEMQIIPHTLEHTICGEYQVGSRINLEVDLLARYLERLMLGDKTDA